MLNFFILLIAISGASAIFISAIYPTVSACLDLIIVETPSFNKYKLKAYIIVSSALLPIMSLQAHPPKTEFLKYIAEYLQYGSIFCILAMIFIYIHDTPAKFLKGLPENKFEKIVYSLIGIFAETIGKFMAHNKLVVEKLSESVQSCESFGKKADERLTGVELQLVDNSNSTIKMEKKMSDVQLNEQILRKDVEELSTSVQSCESFGKKIDVRLTVVEAQSVNNASSTEFCKKKIEQMSDKSIHAKRVEQIISRKYTDEAKIRKLYEENQNLNFDCDYHTFKAFVTLQQVESKILWTRKAKSKLPNYRQAINLFYEIFEVSDDYKNCNMTCRDMLNYYFSLSKSGKGDFVTSKIVSKARNAK